MRRPLFLSAILVVLTGYLGYVVQREQFPELLVAFGAFFAVYLWVVYKEPAGNRTWYIRLGLLLRVLLLFSLPNLSDDFYRFIWDGRLLIAGYHPFAHAPEYFIRNNLFIPGISQELFSLLNSPEYYTVYPPLAQAVFGLAAWLFNNSISGGVLLIKLFLLVCEWGTIRLLLQRPDRTIAHPAVLYALNPLVILEVAGNCHFEGALIFFLLWGIRALERSQTGYAATGWSLAIASKLLPLLFLPLAWRWLGLRRGFRMMTLTGLLTGLLFLPLLNLEILQHMGASLNLYFRQFTFNASFYYLLKAAIIPFASPGLDVGRTIGPLLGLLTLTGVVAIALFRLRKSDPPVRLEQALVLASTLYLLNATTVHPWYVLVPFALSLGTRWRYPLAWTGAVILSYSHYMGGSFRENFWLIGLEYSIVLGVALYQSFPLSPTK